MKPVFEPFEDDIEIYKKNIEHTPPHLHGFIELIYISEGSMEIGVGQELYHMEKGDLSVIFPGQIQHVQVFDADKGTAMHLIASPAYAGSFADTLMTKVPVYPVIESNNLHKDIKYALDALYEEISDSKEKSVGGDVSNKILYQSFISLILIRTLPFLKLVERNEKENVDLIYRTVSYIARNFTGPISLSSMAKDLYVSPFAISRVFSGTFHTNFNKYLNETRLNYALSLLRYSNQTITEVYENAGFESQRTFNRVFVEKIHMSPREYRKSIKLEMEKNSDEQFASIHGNI
ncbi:helix-turn-helix transcriptional regulator [Butyrivibrio sp. AE3004]|uniref:helix-turn-helix transcriptional regulator n=1 Tax=Butyrivibrio sp. AE3004 TaxID=1506994 RepID=UPI0004941D20|nr:AraC family transcriptional regulator [Butyrivibrio sp. AE3004]